MHILYFFQYFSTPQGGYGTRAYEFARRWVAAGDRVTVVTSVYDRSDLRPEKLITRTTIEGIELRIIGIRLSNKHGKAFRLLTFVAYAGLAVWYALTLKADVVISSSPPITAAIPGLAARLLRRTRLVLEVRDLWPAVLVEMGLLRNRFAIALASWFERFCYRHSDAIVALSPGIAQELAPTAAGTPVHVVTNASDNEAFAGPLQPEVRDWAAGKKLAVYAGVLGFANQCGQILDMAVHLEAMPGTEDVWVVLIGDGKERRALEQRAAELKLTRVRFLGQRPKLEVHSWLQAACCSLLVLRDAPITGNGSPNKLFDSLAAGLPVVHNTAGWMKRLVDEEQCGISVPPGNSLALAQAVAALAGDPELRERSAQNARRLAVDRFDRNKLAAEMRAILHGDADAVAKAAAAGASQSS